MSLSNSTLYAVGFKWRIFCTRAIMKRRFVAVNMRSLNLKFDAGKRGLFIIASGLPHR